MFSLNMSLCRLCGEEKHPEDLVVSLADDIGMEVTFKSFVEFYCRFELDSDISLPQKICKICKEKVCDFSQFTYIVEEQQIVFHNKKPKIVSNEELVDGEQQQLKPSESVVEEEKPSEVKIKEEKRSGEEQQSDVGVDVAQLASEEKVVEEQQLSDVSDEKLDERPEEAEGQIEQNDDEEPAEKKPKLDEIADVGDKIKVEPEKQKEVALPKRASRGFTRKRQESILKEKPERAAPEHHNISKNLMEVRKVFGKIVDPEKMTIESSKLLAGGEVPSSYLETFEDFTTWHRMSYTCGGHCESKFDNLNDFLLHTDEHVRKKKRSISCFLCDDRTFQGASFLTTYLNHMSRRHYKYIKFCCVVCSRVYQSMPLLSKHYQNCHPNCRLTLFPCLDCGLYCQSIYHLKKHKFQHDKIESSIFFH